MIVVETPIGEVLPPETIAALSRILAARKTGTLLADVHLGEVRGLRWQPAIVALHD